MMTRMSSYVLEVLEGNYHTRDVVKCPLERRELKDPIYCLPTLLMNGTLRCLHACLPCAFDGLLIAQFLKNAVTGKHYEVVVVADLEALDLGGRNHHAGVPTILGSFCLYVANCTRD